MKNFKTTFDEKLKTWNGMKIPRFYEAETSIGTAALEVMRKNSENIGQICYHNGKAYRNEDLASLSISVAQYFTKLGLQQCDLIGICATNTDFISPLFFGAMLKGLIVSPADATFDKEGIRHIFNMTRPKIMFCDGKVHGKVKTALTESGQDIKIYTLTDHIEGVASINELLKEPKSRGYKDFEPLKQGGSQTAVILCSSGTTGLPKGVTMSHEDLLNNIFIDLQPNDRFINFSSLHWFSGVYSLVWGTLSNCTRIINANGYTPETLLDIVEKYKINKIFTPPSQMALTYASPKLQTTDLSSVEAYFLAGSPVSFALLKQIKSHFPNAVFYNGYGMSEARCGTATGECVEKNGFIGQLAPNCMYKVIGGDGQRLGPNQIGELFFTNPYKWAGYYGNEQQTAATFDAEGWIVSGDLGFFDEHGNICIVDRKKDIMKCDGYQYFPTEIENVIYELPDVVEVCVCGLPDVVSTDLPAAAVVKKIGSNLSEKDVFEYVAQRMMHFKHLRGGVYFMESIPKTSTGKPLRSETKKICEQLRSRLM